MKLEDIWGVSKGWGNRLRSIGINNPRQLQQANPRQIRTLISVVGERIIYELRGQPCLALEEVINKKSITVSRSFGNMINDKDSLKKALANYAARAAEKLRYQDSVCGGIYVFINTNRFRERDLQYSNNATINFDELTDSTTIIIEKSFKLLENLYRPKYNYKKIGVTLLGLKQKDDGSSDNYIIQGSLFIHNAGQQIHISRSCDRMKLIDNINAKMGKMTIFHGSQGVIKNSRNIKSEPDKWRMRSCYKSPFYTTNWDDILKVS